ncbi:hypothetical protein C8Q77DRAFT_343984 [Trametes polyzona]|nr:hypothetical protein C8Q77DRAFT_343984 [Trametes polyzona]
MGKTRKSKTFVESKASQIPAPVRPRVGFSTCYLARQDAAVELAKSVADAEEQKSRAKVEVHHTKASARTASSEGKRTPSSKARLERAKAAVAAQAARAKREKAKLRKKARASVTSDVDASERQTQSGATSRQSVENTTKKKRVTFG